MLGMMCALVASCTKRDVTIGTRRADPSEVDVRWKFRRWANDVVPLRIFRQWQVIQWDRMSQYEKLP